MTPIVEFVRQRLAERATDLSLDSNRLPLADHVFAKDAIEAMRQLVGYHDRVSGDDPDVVCECGRLYPCRPIRALAWVFRDHPDYDETWDPDL